MLRSCCARRGLVFGLAAAAMACGSDAANEAARVDDSAVVAVPDSASSGIKACEVVSTGDLARITGLQLEEGRLTNDYGGVSQCRWSRAGGTDNGVSVSVREQGDMEIYTSVPGAVPVRGLGDDAVWNPISHQMAVRVGPRIGSVTFLYDDGRESQAREIAAIIQRALAPAPAGP
jgi:hypothetical protein